MWVKWIDSKFMVNLDAVETIEERVIHSNGQFTNVLKFSLKSGGLMYSPPVPEGTLKDFFFTLGTMGKTILLDSAIET